MPTYEYQCQVCAHRFEHWQKITSEPLKECPKCGAAVQRLISAGAGFIFKGPGFYATDYRKQDYKKRQKEETQGCPASQGKDRVCKQCPQKKGD